MTQVDERINNPISSSELERRWTAVRNGMRKAEMDALVVQGANGYAGGSGYFRWFTGKPAANTYPQTIIFPGDGLITLVHNGERGGETTLDGFNPTHPGVGRRLTTPSFPAVSYTGGYDAEIIAREIRKSGFRRVGLVGASGMYHGFAAGLKDLLPQGVLSDATELVDGIKAVKSSEEIEWIRRAAAMQDEIMAKIGEYVRPGMRDFEVMAYAQYLGQLAGSETGYFIGSSAPKGQAANPVHKPYHGRRIGEGDMLLFQAENSGPGGFFVHLGRVFVFGKAWPELVDSFGAAIEAREHTLGMLKPGASCRELFAAHNAHMRFRGFPEERRLYAHGQGYDLVERPLIRDDEPMAIAANMNIGIHTHPSASNQRYFTATDNFLVHADGSVERLHRTPERIFEL